MESIIRVISDFPSNTEIELKYILERNDIIHGKDIFSLFKTFKNNEQTVNFIKTNKHSMIVKQLYFDKNIQLKTKKRTYIKTSIIPPVYMNNNPKIFTIKLTCNTEQIIENYNDNIFDLLRFKERHSIKINDKWRLDITAVTEVRDQNIINNLVNVKNIINSLFCKGCNYDKIEIEVEYTGNVSDILLSDLKEVMDWMDNYLLNKNKNNNTYTFYITMIANLLKPNISHKFSSGYFGLKQLCSGPIDLNKMKYDTIISDINNYIVTDKIDGIRTIMIYHNGKYFSLNNKNKQSITDISSDFIEHNHEHNKTENIIKNNKLENIIENNNHENIIKNNKLENIIENNKTDQYMFIIDTELINDTYYMFDIIKYNDIDVFNMTFTERIKYMDLINLSKIKKKEFVKINKMYDFYNKPRNYKIDGLIIFNTNKNYNDSSYYKWKSILTIDFYVRKCPNNMVGVEPYVVVPNKTLYILMNGISDIMSKNLNLSNNKLHKELFRNTALNYKYFPILFEPSDNPTIHLFWSDLDLDNKIVEMTYTPKGFEVCNIRDDRINDLNRKTYYGNNFKYAELIWYNIQNPLKLTEEGFDCNSTYFKVNNNQDYVNIRKFNNFIKNKLILQYSINAKSVIDLASGKAQDLLKYIECNIPNIYMFDYDMDGIIETISRKYKYAEIKKYKNFPKIIVKKIDLLHPYKSNVKLIKDLMINPKSSLIVCNFAIHYIAYNIKKINNFVKLINSLLDKSGIFMYTGFNGLLLHEMLKDKDRIDYGNKYSIIKKYEDDTDIGINQQIDVMLPFSNNTYYTEYIININLIENIFDTYKIKLIASICFDQFIDVFKLEKKIFFDKLDEHDINYIKLHNVYLFRKV